MKLPETIVITGANGQSAVHLAGELLKQGCKLFLLAHQRTERIESLRSDFPHKCWLKNCDLNDFHQIKQVLQDLSSESGLLPDALVHTAAIRSYDAVAFIDSDPVTWNKIITQNISMAYNILRSVLPVLLGKKAGKVVLFGSNVTRTGLPFGSAYAAAKSALANLVRTVAWETAADNVQINMVSPAPLETSLEEDYSGKYLQFRQEYFEAYRKSHPAHKLVNQEDVTQLVLSLLNPEMTALSGEEIFLTGGVL